MGRRHHHPSLFRLFFLFIVSFSLFGVGVVFVWFAGTSIPSIEGFHNRRVVQSTKIYDRTGKVLLYDVHGTVRRTLIPLEDVSRHAKNATIAIEDTEFYQHRGIKPAAIVRAFIANIRDGNKGQGGSTITQQVIKNTILSREKTYTRKIKEAILAIKLERQIPKDKILEIYLNETPYGGTIYGIEEAAQYYFEKPAKELDLLESVYLAALPQAPTYYSPFGNRRVELEERKNIILRRMFESGFINANEYQKARDSTVDFQARNDTGIKAPHFVFFVREYLEKKYGVEAVNEGGLTVVTTLDYDLQKKAEEVVEKYALENEKKFNAENAGIVAIDSKTGQVLAMVGSRGYFDKNIDGNFNVTLAKRQPGSLFKPFVYATAFTRGYTPETVVFDLKTQFSTTCAIDFFETNELCYSPENYDGLFRGPITLRNALAQSINVPSVKVLYLAGIPESLDTARHLGITTLTEDSTYYGLPLVLGGGEVTLYEMVSAYGVFANDGIRHEPTTILLVKDALSQALEEYKEVVGEKALDPESAKTINDILSDNNARTPVFGENSSLHFPGYSVAVKTGTTNDYRDAWVIGYTPSIVIGAWAGNNDNTPMEKRVAGFIIAPLWHEIMQFAIIRGEHLDFAKASPYDVGSLPPALRGAWNEVGAHDILFSVSKENPRLPALNPKLDQQFERWEYPVLLWAGIHPTTTSTTIAVGGVIPSNTNTILITYPTEGVVVQSGHPITITTQSPFGVRTRRVSFLINGVFLGATTKPPFSITTTMSTRGLTSVVVIAEGEKNSVVDEVRFVVQ